MQSTLGLKLSLHSLHEDPASDLVDIPVMCFAYELPPDGLPTWHSWVHTLQSIVAQGFEGWREVVEIKLNAGLDKQAPLSFASVKPVKGLGRVAVILFAIVHTYLLMREGLTEDLKADFIRRCAELCIEIMCEHKSVVFNHCALEKIKRDGVGVNVVFRVFPHLVLKIVDPQYPRGLPQYLKGMKMRPTI